MQPIELILALIAVVAAVALLAERLRISYPILMVIAGLGIGLLPGVAPDVPRVELEPDTVLLLFLPPILFSAAYFLSPRELWRNVRPITLLAVGLVIMTTLAVAVVAMLLAPQMGWPVAIALGAIVSPPDAIAATSIARRLNLPRRLVIILEGESLVNDATALTIYGLAVTAAVTGASLSLVTAATSFVVVAIGGTLIGLAVGWITTWMEARLQRQPPIAVLVVAARAVRGLPPGRGPRRLRRGLDRRRRPLSRMAGTPHPALGHPPPRHRHMADGDLRRERPRVPAHRPPAARRDRGRPGLFAR